MKEKSLKEEEERKSGEKMIEGVIKSQGKWYRKRKREKGSGSEKEAGGGGRGRKENPERNEDSEMCKYYNIYKNTWKEIVERRDWRKMCK